MFEEEMQKYDLDAQRFPLLNKEREFYLKILEHDRFLAHADPMQFEDVEPMISLTYETKKFLEKAGEIIRLSDMNSPDGVLIREYFNPFFSTLENEWRSWFCKYVKAMRYPIQMLIGTITIHVASLPLSFNEEKRKYIELSSKAQKLNKDFEALEKAAADFFEAPYYKSTENNPHEELYRIRDQYLKKLGSELSGAREILFKHSEFENGLMQKKLLILTTIFSAIAAIIALVQILKVQNVSVETKEPLQVIRAQIQK